MEAGKQREVFSLQETLDAGFVRQVGGFLVDKDGAPITQGVYAWAGKPAAAGNAGKVIEITDTIETNGVRAFFQSDNVNWNQIGEVQTTLAKIMAATVAPTIVGFKARATDIGIAGRGILYSGNGSSMIIGQGRQLFFSGLGQRGSPFGSITIDAAGTGANGTHLQVGGSPQLITFPAKCIPISSLVTIEIETFRSSGAGTAVLRGYLGTGTVTPGNANPNQICYGYTYTGSNRFKNDGIKFYFPTATRLVSTGPSDGTVSTNDAANEGTANVNVASQMYFSFAMNTATLNDVWEIKYLRAYLGA